MRISDWSSDVCSSDLQAARLYRGAGRQRLGRHRRAACRHVRILRLSPAPRAGSGGVRLRLGRGDRRGGEEIARRSEEGRVGKECVSQGRSRGSTYPSKKKKKHKSVTKQGRKYN